MDNPLDAAIDQRIFGAAPAAGVQGQAPAIIQADPYKDQAAVLSFFKEAKEECLHGRSKLERIWERNLLYLNDRHWIYWDRRRNSWVDKRMARWMPRPVTNKVAEVSETLTALFSSIRLETTARPVGGDVRNVATAETVDRMQPFLHTDHEMESVMQGFDFWLTVCGNAILHTFYDNHPQWGTIVGGLPVGKPRTVALSPFEVAVPNDYGSFEDSPIVLKMSWRTRRQLEHIYGKNWIKAQKLSWQTSPTERSLQLLRTLANMTNMATPTVGGDGDYSEHASDGITEYELWAKPCDEYPEGLLTRVLGHEKPVVISGEHINLPGPLPFETPHNEKIIPFVHCGFTKIEGRIWATSPVDRVIQKNNQLNRLDALIELIVIRAGNPVWLEPKGAEVKSFTGEPGLVIKYNALSAGGAKPERIAGQNIPSSLFKWREQIVADLEAMAAISDVLRGAKPAGVSAFSTMQLLVERGQARQATVFSRRGAAYRKWLSIALELERQFGPERRTYAAMTPNRGWTFKHFEHADLLGAVEIVVEDGSQAPKTNLGRRAAIEQAKNLGWISADDVEQRYEGLKALGLTDMVPSLDYHVKAALAEQDAFEQWAENQSHVQVAIQAVNGHLQALQAYIQQTSQATTMGVSVMGEPPDLPEVTPLQAKEYHDGRIHAGEHTKWANSDIARELFRTYPALEVLFLRHLELHDLLDAERVMRQQMAATIAVQRLGMPAMPGPEMATQPPSSPEPAPAGGTGQAVSSSNANSAPTRSVPAGNSLGINGQGRGPE